MTDPAALPLRDIHLPEAVFWWPVAPGWWLLTGLLMALAAGLFYWHKRNERIRYAAITMARLEFAAIQQQFDTGQDAKSTVQAVSVLLRRLAISLFPRQDSAGLAGKDWLQFLDQQGRRSLFATEDGKIMLDAPYQREVPQQQAQTLLGLCKQWIEAVAGQQRGKRS
ncbi:MAG: DUF4381 domain-containing protein [Gammaproteobacteria bacterium]